MSNTDCGLHAAVLAPDLGDAWRAFHPLEVGGVILYDVRIRRHIVCPGRREGPRYALQEMAELRLMMIRSWIE